MKSTLQPTAAIGVAFWSRPVSETATERDQNFGSGTEHAGSTADRPGGRLVLPTRRPLRRPHSAEVEHGESGASGNIRVRIARAGQRRQQACGPQRQRPPPRPATVDAWGDGLQSVDDADDLIQTSLAHQRGEALQQQPRCIVWGLRGEFGRSLAEQIACLVVSFFEMEQ